MSEQPRFFAEEYGDLPSEMLRPGPVSYLPPRRVQFAGSITEIPAKPRPILEGHGWEATDWSACPLAQRYGVAGDGCIVRLVPPKRMRGE